MTALFIFNDAYFKQILIYHSNFINNLNSISNSDSERWQNSYFTADKIITNSEEGDLTLDAANLKAKRWEADIQNLTITSRQDTEKYESKQTSAGTSGSVAYGSGGSASVNASYNKAKVDYAQVNEQAGIRVGEGGIDANIHNHAQLNAAIIESSAEESKNRFKAKSISTTDIENRSEIKTESASIGAGTGGINPMQAISSTLSLLGNTNESARSTTKSAISGNIQIETETPENLTALSRDTKNANQRVEKQDLQKVQERQEMAKVIGDITNNAISIATYEEREKINKLGLEKFKLEEKYGKDNPQAQEIGKQITAIQNDIDRTYGIGSEKGMAIRAVTAALQAAAQNDTAGSLVALASPYLNQKIHEMTAGDTAKDKATNLMAHALLSAVEFQVTGKDPLTGAVAGVTGEATAEIIARAYGKPVSELTANEKENISTLSQLAGGLAAALTAKANGTTAEQGGSFIAATSGAETAKRAVENNYLSVSESKRKAYLEAKKAKGTITSDEDQELTLLDKTDIDRDVALVSACRSNPLSSECNVERKKLESIKVGYTASENRSSWYGYPVYERYSDIYPEQSEKINNFSYDYDVLRITKENANKAFSERFGLSKEAVDRIDIGGNLLNNLLAGYSAGKINPKDLYTAQKGSGNAYVDPRTEKLKSVLPTGRQMLDPSEVSFSQATVSYQKKDKSYNYDTMVEDMRKNGWNGHPVDVVNMPDNAPTSMDNTRILAARKAGIQIDAIVHNHSDRLSYNEIKRFKVGTTYPKTWGEAIELRVKRQSEMSGVDKNWSTKFPHGSLYDPKVVK